MTQIGAQSVTARLLDFIVQTFPVAKAKKIGERDPLFTLGVLDSMGILEVLMFVQREFGIAVDTADLVLENFGSIEAMAKFVCQRIPA